MALTAGSDARVVSPLFTDLDEAPAAADALPSVSVTSLLAGPLPAPTGVEPHPEVPGLYRAVLTAADHLTGPDRLSVVWSATVDGAARVLPSTVEVAGGTYVPLDVLAGQRALPETAVTLDVIRLWGDVFEHLAELARGVAFVPRMEVEDMTGCGPMALRWARPRELMAVWVDGVLQDLTGWRLDRGAAVVTGPRTGPVRVAYTHGHDQPPPALVVAERDYVRAKTLSMTSDQMRNAISFTDRVSGETYRYGTADWERGRWTGMESIDSIISAVEDERIPGIA